MRSSLHAGVGDPLIRADAVVLRSPDGRREVRVTAAAKVPLAGRKAAWVRAEWDFGGGMSSATAVSGTFLFADATSWQTAARIRCRCGMRWPLQWPSVVP